MGEKQGRVECNVITQGTEIKDWPQETWSGQ